MTGDGQENRRLVAAFEAGWEMGAKAMRKAAMRQCEEYGAVFCTEEQTNDCQSPECATAGNLANFIKDLPTPPVDPSWSPAHLEAHRG